MGMFDNIEYRGRAYQTKDTPAQMLDNYKIEQDLDSGHWYLWHEEYDAEWVEEEGLFGGSIRQSNHRWSHCADFDGELRFYYYRTDEDQEEYKAVFIDGQMLKIRCTQGEPLTEWLTAGIEERALK
jgi:hypothetical protein